MSYSSFCRSDQLTYQTRLNLYVTILLSAVIPESRRTTGLLDELLRMQFSTVSPFSYYCPRPYHMRMARLVSCYLHNANASMDRDSSSLRYVLCLYGDLLQSADQRREYRCKRFISVDKPGFKMKIIAVQILVFLPWSFYVWIKGS